MSRIFPLHRMNVLILLIVVFLYCSGAYAKPKADDLFALSIEGLMQVEIDTKTKRNLADVSSSVHVYSAQRIKEHGWTSLSELLPHVPGIDISSTGSGLTLSVRGISDESVHGSKVVIMIDGHDMGMSSTNSNSFHGFQNQFDIRNAKRVEVLLGPSSVLHGANAYSIIVNIITKSRDNIEQSETSITVGSNQEVIPTFMMSKNYDKWSVYLSGIYWYQDDTELAEILMKRGNGAEQIYNNDIFEGNWNRNYSFHAKLEYDKQYSLGVITSRTDQGLGTNFINTKVGSKGIDQHLIYFDANKILTSDWDYKLSSHFKIGSFDTDDSLFHFGIGDPALDIPAPPTHRVGMAKMKYDSLVIDNLFIYTPKANITLLGGVFYERSRQSTIAVKVTQVSAGTPVPPDDPLIAKWDNYALYLQTEWQVTDRLDTILGLRSVHSINDQFKNITLPRVGAIYTVDNHWKLKFNAQRGYRPPSEGEVGNTGAFYVKNPDIKPETIDAVELTLLGNFTGHNTIYTTVFLYEAKDLIKRIDYLPTADLTDVSDVNFGEFSVQGLEIGGSYQINEAYLVEGAYTYTNSKDNINNTDAKMIIPHKLNLSFIAHPLPDWSVVLDNYIRINPTTLIDNTVYLGKDAPDWMVSNLHINVDRAFSLDNFSIGFSIRNMFNEKYGLTERRAASIRNPDIHPQELRNYMLSLSYQYN